MIYKYIHSNNSISVDTVPVTVGIDYKTKYIVVNDINVKLAILDTAIQDRFRVLYQHHIPYQNAIIYVYDTKCTNSVYETENYIKFARNHSRGNLPSILVANVDVMYDLSNSNKDVSNKDVSNKDVCDLE
ncbi:MAG: rab family gtpase, partial [Homavirus sp.]